jgi:hypothetical protein
MPQEQRCDSNDAESIDRLHLLLPGPRIILFVKTIFITEFVFVEIPTNFIQFITFNTSVRAKLIDAAKWCGWIEIILYSATCVAATSVYLHLACSKPELLCQYA